MVAKSIWLFLQGYAVGCEFPYNHPCPVVRHVGDVEGVKDLAKAFLWGHVGESLLYTKLVFRVGHKGRADGGAVLLELAALYREVQYAEDFLRGKALL